MQGISGDGHTQEWAKTEDSRGLSPAQAMQNMVTANSANNPTSNNVIQAFVTKRKILLLLSVTDNTQSHGLRLVG
jgi:hypothetical protein